MAARAIFKMPAFCAEMIEKEKLLAEGDKIVLHKDILEKLLRIVGKTLPTPIIFEITNLSSSKVSHCGVLEFTAPRQAAFLPNWMMANLDIKDGGEVQLKLKSLPSAEKLKFQPREQAFLAIPDPKTTLEFALRKFTALTRGDEIFINFGKGFYLKVLDVAPSSSSAGVSIVNCSPTVEFEEPKEKKAPEKEFIEFDLENPAKGDVKPGEWNYYRFKIVDVNMAICFKLKCSRGDAGMYISTTTRPSNTAFTWCARASEDKVMIEPDHKQFSKSWYWIGVCGFREPSQYVLSAEEVLPESERPPEKKAPVLGRLDSENPPEGAKRCETCLHYIPAARMTMHSLHCARNNYRCPSCKVILHASKKAEHVHCKMCDKIMSSEEELAKHIELLHKPVPCPACGMAVPPDTLSFHQQEECRLRMMSCKYCQLKVTAQEKYEHENYCGSKSGTCEVCNKPVSVKKMEIHMASEHGYNPSLEPGSRGYKSIEQLKKEWRESQRRLETYRADRGSEIFYSGPVAGIGSGVGMGGGVGRGFVGGRGTGLLAPTGFGGGAEADLQRALRESRQTTGRDLQAAISDSSLSDLEAELINSVLRESKAATDNKTSKTTTTTTTSSAGRGTGRTGSTTGRSTAPSTRPCCAYCDHIFQDVATLERHMTIECTKVPR